jgi:hypothetical protein
MFWMIMSIVLSVSGIRVFQRKRPGFPKAEIFMITLKKC